MASRLLLRIVTPKQPLLETEVQEVTAPGTVGEFGVLPEHVTFLSSLETGVLRYRKDQREAAVAIRGGFAEVRDNIVTILADDAQAAEQISAEATREELASAEAVLKRAAFGSPEYVEADARKRWAEARLQAARLRQVS
ncbi:MAG: ATP synthase F1 subunit epsilon [Candidatus Binatia bacterium]|nr:ATP synthase F1 subunit epsilon [Candidatus Binatia bacterium]